MYKRISYSFLFSLIINIGIILSISYVGRSTKAKAYKVYKIDVVKLIQEKQTPLKRPTPPALPKPHNASHPIPKPPQTSPPSLITTREEPEMDEEPLPVDLEENKEPSTDIIPAEEKYLSEPEGDIFEAHNLDAPLKLISYKHPPYPDKARSVGIEGRVVVKLLISPTGIVKKAEVLTEEPKGFGFSRSVLDVIFDYQFSEPNVMGDSVWVYCILPLRFSLE